MKANYDHSSPSEASSEPPADWRAGLRDAGPYLGLGLQLALSMAFFVGAGYAADQWWGTMPWLTVAGSVLGMVAIFILIFRTSSEMNAETRRRAGKREGEKERG